MPDAPHNLLAERHLLGAMLLSSHAVDVAHRVVTADEFYELKHKTLFQSTCDVWLSGAPADVVSVSEAMRPLTVPKPSVDEMRAMTSNCVGTDEARVRHFAEIVVEHASLRSLRSLGERIVKDASELAESASIVQASRERLDGLALPTGSVEPGPDLDAFLAEKTDTDWLVPDFLERTDRVILTGEEGRGKSTALRQAGLQMAAGIVPFTASRPCEPVRVLLVDCENPRGKLQRQLAPLRATAGDRLDPTRFVPIPVERGLDLGNRADRRWLEERVAANRPDVLITGPIYKLHAGDPTEERPAARLRDFFDDLRTRFGFALLLEAHQPYASGGQKRPLRPYGASLWSRWPDIGLCLLEGDGSWSLAEFRGLREDRSAWPLGLTRHPRQVWPWMASVRNEGT